jgi:aminoglycoside phosphotransferase (APT) family kinase protein
MRWFGWGKGEGLEEKVQVEPVGADVAVDDDEATRIALEQRSWGIFNAIPDDAFSRLVQQYMEKHDKVSRAPFRVEGRLHGSYNYAVIMNDGTSRLVVKIPQVGCKEYWDPRHAYIMRSEAHTLMYIKHKLPHFPCPELLAKDETFDNVIGAPYLMQSFLEGKSALQTWFEGVLDEDGFGSVFEANNPPDELEAKRVTFLSSLATTMAELRHLEFDTIGMLYLEDESDPESVYVGPHYDFFQVRPLWRKYYSRPVFKSSDAYYRSRHVECSKKNKAGPDFMRARILVCAPFDSSKKRHDDTQETFTLSLDDLNLQNILVNAAGEVTGILDWDQVTVTPRCVGFSTVPVFLQEDFRLAYSPPMRAETFPWNLTKYRKVYAAAMKKACHDCEEVAQYCEKSALYMAVQNMMYQADTVSKILQYGLMKKLMLEIPELRSVNINDFGRILCGESGGVFWLDACEIWVKGIREVLDPNAK